MKSYKIFTIFGIAVELHITFILFFLLILLVVIAGYGIFSGILAAILFIFLFGTVLAHELAHSAVAKRAGVKVDKIILLPIGGLASVDMPEDPKLEFAISIAGPGFNFIFAGILILFFAFAYPDAFGNYVVDTLSDFIQIWIYNNHEVEPNILNISSIPNALGTLIWINLVIGIFNLFLPAFPLDGGRVLRSLLAMITNNYLEATRYAVYIGQIIFGLLLVIGIFRFAPIIVFIALFMLLVAPSELKIVEMRHYLRGHTAGEIALKKFVYVNDTTPLIEFLKTIAVPEQIAYPVTNHEKKIIGYINLHDLDKLDKKINNYLIKNIMKASFGKVNASAPAEHILKLINKDFIFVVNDNEQVVGFITPDYLVKIARFKKYEKTYLEMVKNKKGQAF